MEGRLIVCAMDARRGQVYNALFLARGDSLERLAPDRAISLEESAVSVDIRRGESENQRVITVEGVDL